MNLGGVLLALSLLAPLGLLLAYFTERFRERVPGLLGFAPLPAVVAALLAQGGMIALPRVLLSLTLSLDVPGAALLLGVGALMWSAGGFYAADWLRGEPGRGRFVIWWLVTLIGSMGTFMAADLVSFYLLFSMVSLAAYGLVVHDGSASSRRAGVVYVALAVLGEAFLLMGFVFLAQGTPGDSLLIHDAVAALPHSPWRVAALVLLILGFGCKIGMVPLHVWMPLAYAAAPIPAAAVLSGVAVKAGVIGFIRFMPTDLPSPAFGAAMATIGLFAAFAAAAVGITQRNPKVVLAYSSVSQMGVLAAVFGQGLAAGTGGVGLAAAFYAAHHILVKGGLFLAIGVAGRFRSLRSLVVLLPAAILSLSLAGLPLTGGALAKLAVKGPLGDGLVGALGGWTAASSTLLMLHFLGRLVATEPGYESPVASWRQAGVWLAVAVAAVAVPWAVYAAFWGNPLAYQISPDALWKAGVPMLTGAVLAVPVLIWGERLPFVVPGDVVVPMEQATEAVLAQGVVFDRLDVALRRWPVAGLALLVIAVVLGAAFLVGG